MTPERWARVRDLLEAALERPSDERRAFVAGAAGGDAELAAEVTRLIDAEERATGFLETPAAAALAPGSVPEETGPPGTRRVGPYVLHEKIGQGGMGRVYRAVRREGDYQRQVALKIVNRGMNTEFILRRFRNERQILAGLDHPTIAHLYDGGTTDDGLPYFAMEYIEGKDLLAWCDARRLDTEGRLRIFLQVCAAVAYAHRNLVVHRDLKPSNILVTAEGTPKLLDFGLAKILNADVSSRTADITAIDARLLTPEYASPEQIRGEKITTSTDVYSLGVLLYELLTGHRPYRLKTRETVEIARAVCEEEPERPSTAVTRVETVPGPDGEGERSLTPVSVAATREGDAARLRKRLAGDLDTIVLMCLRKEPERRYGSVELLAEDVQRHLDGRPVRARRDTLGYRAGKFVRRNRVPVAAALLVGASLVVGLGVSLRQTRLARAERARAERRFEQLRRLARTFLFDVHDAVSDLPGATKVRGLLVKEGLAYLDSLAQEAGEDRALRAELAEGYLRLAQVQSAVGTSNEGDSTAALPSFKKAIALRESLAAGVAPGSREEDDLAEAQIRYAGFLVKTGDLKEGIAWGRKAVAHREAVFARNENDLRAAARLGTTLQMHAYALSADGETVEARRMLERSIRQFEIASAAPRPEAWLPQGLAWAYADLAETYERAGDHRTALVYLEKTRTLDEAILATDPLNVRARLRLVFALLDTGYNLSRLGEHARARDAVRRAVPIAEALAAEDVKNEQARSALGTTRLMVGEVLAAARDARGAIAQLDAAAAIFESMVAADPLNAWARVQLGRTYLTTGDAWAVAGAGPRACGSYRRALDVFTLLRNEGRLPGSESSRFDEAAARAAACAAGSPGR